MAENQGVAYMGTGKVEVQDIDYPKLRTEGPTRARERAQCQHGVILKVITTNICGSDQHMVRGRTTAPAGLILGHEITGEVIEAAGTSSSSRRVTSAPCRSTSPAVVAACARRATRACA